MIHHFDHASPDADMYRINSEEMQSINSKKIIEILSASSYRPDFRNLFSGILKSADADKNYNGQNVILSLGNQEDGYFVQINFMSNSFITVHIWGESGFRIYHPTNSKTIGELIEYIQKYGIKQ